MLIPLLAFLAATAAAPAPPAAPEFRMDFTVNPDGSGKVAIEIVMPPFAAAPGQPGAAAMVRQRAGVIVQKAAWAETWTDVAFAETEGGGARFKGTAYFKDLAAVGIGWALVKGMTWSKDAAGDATLSLNLHDPPPPPAKLPQLTDEQLAQRMAMARQAYAQVRGFVSPSPLARMKMCLTYRLPGKLAAAGGFEKAADGSLQWTMDPDKERLAADAAMADDDFVKTCIMLGREPTLEAREKGTRTVRTARVAGEMKPPFDYQAEVKAAREAYPKMMEKSGLNQPPADKTPVESAKPPAETSR
jgi:hypothetical protein